MKTLFVLTPKGLFKVYIVKIQHGLHVSTIFYEEQFISGSLGKACSVLQRHQEEASTEQQSLERLRAWCQNMFGWPSTMC